MSTRARLGQVAAPVHAGEVHVLLVGAADEIRQLRCGVVDIDLPANPIGPIEPGSQPVAWRTRSALAMRSGLATPGELLRLDGVELVVAAQDQRDHVAVAAVHQQGLHALRAAGTPRNALSSAMVRAFGVATLRQRLRGRRARRGRRKRSPPSRVRGVVAARRESDGILARVGEHVKFLRDAARRCCRRPPARRGT